MKEKNCVHSGNQLNLNFHLKRAHLGVSVCIFILFGVGGVGGAGGCFSVVLLHFYFIFLVWLSEEARGASRKV